MLSIETIQQALKDRNLLRVAEQTGLHYNTVRAVARGKTTVQYWVIKKLSDYLEAPIAR
jgi:hypothetical protein